MICEDYDDLLAVIQHDRSVCNGLSEPTFKALTAVVLLHNSVKGRRGKSGMAIRCTECGFAYPCPTITAISKELGIT